jgi:hypothetical protein
MPYIGRTPTGVGSVSEIDGDLTVTGNIKSGGQLTANDTLFKMIMDTAADLGDNFLIEDGGTDGSGTNAGDDICLEKDLQVIPAGDIISISGVAGAAAGINIGTPTATTSGTTIDISIPTGTRAIWVSYDAVSAAASGEIALRLGDSGGVETSEYISYLGSFQGGGTSMDSSTALWKLVEQASATCIWYGTVQLFLQNASTYTWCFSSCLNTLAGTTQTNISGGRKSLSAELTTLQLLTTSGDYDAGAVNIVYI